MAFHRGPKIITDGLVLYLDAANTKSYPQTGTVWKDLSGNGNDGTLVNGPTFDSGSNGSIVFDGVNDYGNTNTDLQNISYLTLNVWLKFNTQLTRAWFGILTKNNFNDFAFAVGGSSAPGRGVIYLINNLGQNTGNLTTNDRIDDGNWHNLVTTFDGDRVRIYTDGIQDKSTPLSGTLRSTVGQNVMISSYLGTAQFFQGNISQVQIYNRALTPGEIQQNYNATKSRFGL